MEIRNRHMYQGAALAQIAEHSQFTAINRIPSSRSAFLINDGIVIYIKYATEPVQYDDYIFTFTRSQKSEIELLSTQHPERVFIALICVEDRQICCISYDELAEWFEKRRAALEDVEEETSTVLVKLPEGQSFRLNMNMPGTRGQYLDEAQIISRSDFPDILFGH
ncbi:MAG: hypothetical protein OXD31_16235 [Chloroflexi bacterium]|nr:hypothetical protein [Chloroflexota bacterium]